MEVRKVVGQVTPEERNEIQALFERKNGLTELAKIVGTTELMLIAGIALLLFGGKKLPEMMRGMGRGISEFKKGAREATEPFEEVKNGIEEAKKDIDEVVKG